MKIGIQTAGVCDIKSIKTDVAMLAKIGMETIELELDMEHLSREYYQLLKDALEIQGITVSQIQVPRRDFLLEDQEKILQEMEKCMDLCEWLGCPYLIVHPFSIAQKYENRKKGVEQEEKQNMEFFQKLIVGAKKHHITICLTNELTNINGHWCMGCCSVAKEAKRYIDYLNKVAGEDCFGFCVHMGRMILLSADVKEMLCVLGARVKCVQLCENDGIRDMTMAPFTCYTIAGQKIWDLFIRGLQEIGYEGCLIATIRGFVGGVPSTLKWDAIQWIQRVLSYIREKVNFVHALQLDKKIYLFGSGNGFDNFMKHYGKVCEPVAILDNSKAKWGRKKNGLEICSPQILLQEDKEQIQIVICNIFFLEIEEQLREMGIENTCRYEEILAL